MYIVCVVFFPVAISHAMYRSETPPGLFDASSSIPAFLHCRANRPLWITGFVWTWAGRARHRYCHFFEFFFDLFRRRGGSPWDRRGIPARSCSLSRATSEQPLRCMHWGMRLGLNTSQALPRSGHLLGGDWLALADLGVGHRGNSWANRRV